MLAGIGLVGTVAASVAAYFVGQDEKAEQTEVLLRLQKIESTLDEIRRRLD